MQTQLLSLGGESWIVIRPDDAIEKVKICQMLGIVLEKPEKKKREKGWKRQDTEKDRICEWCGFFFKTKRIHKMQFCKAPGCKIAKRLYMKCRKKNTMEDWKVALLRRNLKSSGLMK